MPTAELALRWSLQAAQGLAYIHSKGVLQTDISCSNMLLDKSNNLVLCDFAGSSLDGGKPTVASGTRYQRPYDGIKSGCSIEDEIFALGSAIYEIWTTQQSYQDEEEELVTWNYRQRRYPDVENLPVADIMTKCWKGTYTSISEAEGELEKLQKQLLNVRKSNPASQSLFETYIVMGMFATSILLPVFLAGSRLRKR